MGLAILCSGQGGQHAATFDGLLREPNAASLVARADGAAGFDVVSAARGPALFDNATAQPLICAYQGVAWTLLAPRLAASGVAIDCFAGYSVGELGAHGCAGDLSWTDAVALARSRAAAMTAAGGDDDGLVAVRGLPRAGVDALLSPLGVFVAIVNGDDQCIVGGAGPALAAFTVAAAARGAVVRRLPVGIAAHTPLLHDAVAVFRAALERARWHAPIAPVLAGIDGSRVRDAAGAIDALSRQIAETVRWSDCMDAIVERRIAACLELGPGDALARMMRDRHPGVEVRSMSDFRSVGAVADWVVRVAS